MLCLQSGKGLWNISPEGQLVECAHDNNSAKMLLGMETKKVKNSCGASVGSGQNKNGFSFMVLCF